MSSSRQGAIASSLRCTCPYFADRVDIRKHISATILLAEQGGIPLFAGATQQKRSLADAVLKAGASLLRTLRREDLELLLS